MADFDTRFKSNTVEWATPPEVYDPLNREFGFTLDVAATSENAKCPRYYTRKDDGLAQPWDGVCWMNPPYGKDVPKWLARALEESKRGVTTVCLIPARTNTKWFHDLCLSVAEVRFVKGRPKFGDADHGLPLPLAVVVYRPRYGSVCMANRPVQTRRALTYMFTTDSPEPLSATFCSARITQDYAPQYPTQRTR